jgi:2,4-dienoyl-CoA reductase-like NADH-dependent reductase (Old Yellow Enzyme family)
MPTLFDPLHFGDLLLPSRIIMAPLTRCHAGESRVPNDLMREYYVQRSSAGLILTEATSISPQGVGYAGSPGIWSLVQVAGWRRITDAVHLAGGHIYMQLWHVGRISHPMFLNGQLPVASSAVAPEGNVSLVRPKTPYLEPRALATAEIPNIVEDYRRAAINAQRAGFDGVELHGANGYLLDQFLQDNSNQRLDEYGGPIENRARLMLEATDACIGVWGAGRVGVHLAPRCDAYSMGDSNPAATFGYVARELGRRKIAYICAREYVAADSLGPALKKAFGGVYIANEGFTQASAQKILDEGHADAVAFGQLFIANPDLPKRFAMGAPLNTPNPRTYYAEGTRGYTDYPSL